MTYNQLKAAFTLWLNMYEWQWYVTLTFPDTITDTQFMFKRFGKFKTDLAQTEKLCIGYFVTAVVEPHSHVHGVMLGSPNTPYAGCRTLLDVDTDKWKNLWVTGNYDLKIDGRRRTYSKDGQDIDNSIRSSFDVSEYITKNKLKLGSDYTFSSPRFLKKHIYPGITNTSLSMYPAKA